MWNLIALCKYSPAPHREGVGKLRQPQPVYKSTPSISIEPFRTIYEAHFCDIQTSYNVIKVGRKKNVWNVWTNTVSFDPTNDARMWLVSYKINGRLQKACPPPTTHTHIRSKYSTGANTKTDLEIYKGAWTHSWAIGSHLVRPKQADFPLFVPLLSDRSPFLHYQSVSQWSFCFWGHRVHFLHVATAEKVYWMPWRCSSRPPRDSSSHLERGKSRIKFNTTPLTTFVYSYYAGRKTTAGLTYPGTLPEDS